MERSGTKRGAASILWRARADKSSVLRPRGKVGSGHAEDWVGSSDDEDIDETVFNKHYLLALEGELPRIPERELHRRDSGRASAQPPRKRARLPSKPKDAFAFDDSSQLTQPPVTEEGEEGGTLNVLDDALASQASSFPFSQLPDVSFASGSQEKRGEAVENLGLPSFLDELLENDDDDGKGPPGKGPLMYELSQTDYLKEDRGSSSSLPKKASKPNARRSRD